MPNLQMKASDSVIGTIRPKPLLDRRLFYIGGEWVNPAVADDFPVINPATEEPIATISLGTQADVNQAVAAAQRAFESYSKTQTIERWRLLQASKRGLQVQN
jgi:aldehyde dehydrogenase (NAD+)